MKISEMRDAARKKMESLESLPPAKSWDEARSRGYAITCAEMTLRFCDIYDQLTEKEVQRLRCVSACQQDLRCVGDIREKYNLAWKGLRQIIVLLATKENRRYQKAGTYVLAAVSGCERCEGDSDDTRVENLFEVF